jgi:hypothetical protein
MEESQDGLELITLNKAMRLHKDQFEAKGTLPHAFAIRVFKAVTLVVYSHCNQPI